MTRKLLIIIPCYNEEAAIGGLLDELLRTPLPASFAHSVVVVNDCSTDGTKRIVEQYPRVTLLNLPYNLGIGGAMQAGYRYAHAGAFDLALQMDGDGQHPPSEIIRLLEQWQATEANVVIGSRFLKREGYQSSFLRRGGINYLRWFNRLLTGINIHDCTSGFRLFDARAIALAMKDYPDDYPEPESLVRFAKAGLKMEEVSVVMRKRQGGASSIRYGSQLYYIIKVTIAMFYSFIRKK